MFCQKRRENRMISKFYRMFKTLCVVNESMQNKACLNTRQYGRKSATCKMDDVTERISGFQDAF